ncbi:MAG: NuA4 histone H4 acetyltransferase complex and the SWR1 complex subunit [Chrysothrix sp. TS-e1954]|nr:MAG: NuA4 histone H4 acetyltransferase complex and the SWR1 complex subunit [Chrysothrix sp. TS-e1954]
MAGKGVSFREETPTNRPATDTFLKGKRRTARAKRPTQKALESSAPIPGQPSAPAASASNPQQAPRGIEEPPGTQPTEEESDEDGSVDSSSSHQTQDFDTLPPPTPLVRPRPQTPERTVDQPGFSTSSGAPQTSDHKIPEITYWPSPHPSPRPSKRKRNRNRNLNRKRKGKRRMPAATSTKRVRGTRIERPFFIGSVAWPLDSTNRKPGMPEEHTKGWRVYVRAADGQAEISVWLKKVSFKIYHTYPNPTRVVEAPPFEIEETGWGGFPIEVRLYFATEASAKAEYRTHFLQLEPYGDEAMQQRQRDEKLVRSEVMEIVEFNDPPEAFFNLMTDAALNFPQKKGKGKGKAKINGASSDNQGTVELPESGGADDAFTKENERRILEELKEAEKKLDELLAEENRKEVETRKKLAELKLRQQRTQTELQALE